MAKEEKKNLIPQEDEINQAVAAFDHETDDDQTNAKNITTVPTGGDTEDAENAEHATDTEHTAPAGKPGKQKNKTPDTMGKAGRAKRLRYNSFLFATVAVVVAVVVGINVIFSLLVTKYNWNLDFTGDSSFTLSQESKDYAKKVDVPVTISVLAKESAWGDNATYAQILSMLRSYTTLNKNITLQFVDLDANPTFVKKYPDLDLAANDILFSTKYRTKRIDSEDLSPSADYSSYYTTGTVTYQSKAENLMTGSLYSVCNQTQPVVLLLTGHGEDATDNEKLTYQLELNGYTVKTVNLLTTKLDTTAQFVVLTAPAKDYTADELKVLDSFLATKDKYSKSIVYFADPTKTAPTNLNSFLKEWGISIGAGLTGETDQNHMYAYNNQLLGFMLAYPEDDDIKSFTGDFASANQVVAGTYSVPMTKAFEEKGYIKVKTLLNFTTGVLYEEKDGSPVKAATQPSEFPVALLAEKVTYDTDANENPASNVLVFGSPLQSAYFSTNIPSAVNLDYVVNAMNTLLSKEDGVNVSIRTVNTYTLKATTSSAQLVVMLIIFAIVIPVALLIAGLVIWLRRRRL